MEGKVASAERHLYDQFSRVKKSENNKLEEIKVAKTVIKKNNDKIVSLRMDIKENNEVFKRKEKEIYNLETKVAYQEHTIALAKRLIKTIKMKLRN